MAGLTVFPHSGAASRAPALSTDLLAIVVAVVAFCVSGMFLLFLVPDRTRNRVVAVEPTAAAAAVVAPEQAEFGHGSHAPLGGIGSPPKRFARHLPIEREGATRHVSVDAIVAVHANAHYTYVFDGTSKLFCPLPISDVEARLDASRFVRVHRSHIVNIERVVRLKRAGDSGLVELDAADSYLVPVSRSRVGSLRSRIDAMTGDVIRQAS